MDNLMIEKETIKNFLKTNNASAEDAAALQASAVAKDILVPFNPATASRELLRFVLVNDTHLTNERKSQITQEYLVNNPQISGESDDGVKHKSSNLSSKTIQKMVCEMEVLKYNLPCENVKYLFSNWEIDVLSINKNDYLTEYEVKISRSDFKADAKKRKWSHYRQRTVTMIPNYFYYTCPKGLILQNEIPEFAGLIYATVHGLIIVKKAPLLHNAKYNRAKLLTKFCRVMTERTYLGSCRMTYDQ